MKQEEGTPGKDDTLQDLINPPLNPFIGQPVTNDAEVEKLRRETPEEALARVIKESGVSE